MATLYGTYDNNMNRPSDAIRIERVSNGFIVYSAMGIHVFSDFAGVVVFLGEQKVY